jgi:hypothetical protein
MFPRTMVYRAQKLRNGKVVVLEPDYLPVTTKIVDTEGDYQLALSCGWCPHPMDALKRFEEEEQALGQIAAERAYRDSLMSAPAQREADAIDRQTVKHLGEIPEQPRRRGRPKKVVTDAPPQT